MKSQFKNVAEKLSSVMKVIDMMANRPLVAVNLKVVSTRLRLVAEKMNFLELSFRDS